MSGVEFTNLPEATILDKDQNFLVVDTEGKRITAKSLFYDQLALLKYLVDGGSTIGLTPAGTWLNFPFNNLSTSGDWVSLNADGSFVLEAGLYLLQVNTPIRVSGSARLRLWNGAATLAASNSLSPSTGDGKAPMSLIHLVNLGTQKTLSVQVAVASSGGNLLTVGDSFLSGISISVGDCLIRRLG